MVHATLASLGKAYALTLIYAKWFTDQSWLHGKVWPKCKLPDRNSVSQSSPLMALQQLYACWADTWEPSGSLHPPGNLCKSPTTATRNCSVVNEAKTAQTESLCMWTYCSSSSCHVAVWDLTSHANCALVLATGMVSAVGIQLCIGYQLHILTSSFNEMTCDGRNHMRRWSWGFSTVPRLAVVHDKPGMWSRDCCSSQSWWGFYTGNRNLFHKLIFSPVHLHHQQVTKFEFSSVAYRDARWCPLNLNCRSCTADWAKAVVSQLLLQQRFGGSVA